MTNNLDTLKSPHQLNPAKIMLTILLLAMFLAVTACSDSTSTNKVSYKTEDVQALAQTVKAKEIIMYGTPDCMYCNQAKGWLNQNNFPFTDCDMYASKRCEQAYYDYNGNGTPLIVIKRHGTEHVMRDGFDTDELLLALQAKE